MDKAWVEQKNAEQKSKLDTEIAEFRKYLKNETPLLPSEVEQAITYILKEAKDGYAVEGDMMPFWGIIDNRNKYYETDEMRAKFLASLFNAAEGLRSRYRRIFDLSRTYDRYLDSEPVEFDGDIIITDPCYILRDGDSHIDDWEKCEYGDNMETIGIHNYMTRDTLYGDWSCTTFNTDTSEVIGQFCADAGLVSVFLLDEVLRYNPNFDYHINRTWTTTLIKDFKGTVKFVVKREEGVYDETTKYWNAGDTWVDYAVEVVGRGINKVTGEPINFVGKQTGL